MNIITVEILCATRNIREVSIELLAFKCSLCLKYYENISQLLNKHRATTTEKIPFVFVTLLAAIKLKR